MATVKVVIFFNQNRSGWTETYYSIQNSSNPLADAIKDTFNLCVDRNALLCHEASIDAYRCTVLDGPLAGASTLTGGLALDVQDPLLVGTGPWQALMINVATANELYKRKIMLRGLPTAWWLYDPSAPLRLSIAVALRPKLETFLKRLRNNPNAAAVGNLGTWAIRASNKDRVLNPKFKVISAGVTAPGAYFTITAESTFVPVLGEKIHVGNVKGPGSKGLAGDATITKIRTAEFEISRKQLCPDSVVTLTGATVLYRRVYVFNQIVTAKEERFLKRDTGRSFFSTVGAQQGMKC